MIGFVIIVANRLNRLPPLDAASKADYLRLVHEHEDDGRWMEAMVIAKKGIKAFPPGIEFRLALAEVHVAAGREKKAVKVLRELLGLAPDNAPARALIEKLTGRPT